MALFFLASPKDGVCACLHLRKISNGEKRELSAVSRTWGISTGDRDAEHAGPGQKGQRNIASHRLCFLICAMESTVLL